MDGGEAPGVVNDEQMQDSKNSKYDSELGSIVLDYWNVVIEDD